jgi:hypothetical protein
MPRAISPYSLRLFSLRAKSRISIVRARCTAARAAAARMWETAPNNPSKLTISLSTLYISWVRYDIVVSSVNIG